MKHRHCTTGLFTALAIAALWSTAAVAQVATCGGDVVNRSYAVEIDLTFDRTYTENYRPGEPYDYVTINPAGSGETFGDTGITLRVRVLCVPNGASLDDGEPVVGLPSGEIVLFSGSLCMCEAKFADHDTDADGWTEFSGTISGGGCAEGLDLFVDGIYVSTIPVNINSPDTGISSPCHTDASDLANLATRLGDPGQWSICFDYNESGPPTINASDLAFFASMLEASCQ